MKIPIKRLFLWFCIIIIASLISGIPLFMQIYESSKSNKLFGIIAAQISNDERWKNIEIGVSPKGPLIIHGYVLKNEDKVSLKQLIDNSNTVDAKILFIISVANE